MHTNVNVRIILFHPEAMKAALQKRLSHLYPKEISRVYPALELVLHKRDVLIVWEKRQV